MRSTPSGREFIGRGRALIGLLVLLALASVAVTACSGDSTSANKTSALSGSSSVEVTSTPVGTATTSASARPSTTKATPTTPKPTSTTTLGGDCSSVLPLLDVDKAVAKTVPGKTAFIVNVPDYSIFQVERVNCQYGLVTAKGKTTPAAPLVEASVSLYNTNAHATARVDATIETWREHSAVPHKVTVAGHPGVVLTGYGTPLLVLGVGPRTFAIGISSALVAAARQDAVLVELATSALHGSGG